MLLAKVSMKLDMDGSYQKYHIKSKSLTAALQRATLVVEALGQDRVDDFQVYPPDPGKTKFHIYIYTKHLTVLV